MRPPPDCHRPKQTQTSAGTFPTSKDTNHTAATVQSRYLSEWTMKGRLQHTAMFFTATRCLCLEKISTSTLLAALKS
jgi:hypothetical protein